MQLSLIHIYSATKNVIKKMFYLMLAARTGKEMPWGCLLYTSI